MMQQAVKYWCRDCPAVFTDATSGEVHRANTQHRLTWRPSFRYQPPTPAEESK